MIAGICCNPPNEGDVLWKRQLLRLVLVAVYAVALCYGCRSAGDDDPPVASLSVGQLKDKIKGAWAAQTIGVTYGGPTEFRYRQTTIPDSIEIEWYDSMMYEWMTGRPGLYDDIYMDLTFVQVMQQHGLDAPAEAHAQAYANAEYALWHANQQGRYNVLHGIGPPASGHWLNNPHADDIDFQIEADFAGIMAPGMPVAAAEICDRVGHIMNYGDGYYGGVMVAAMYSHAFVMDDISSVVRGALDMIPPESKYHQCMSDVIRWHEQHPGDWRIAWQKIEETWGTDVGCPDGAAAPFNIDATINSAYVLLGLLYGEGDFGKTLEIATRAGQDSDCNPATAAGILGTMTGYRAIPAEWSRGLALIEGLDFKYTEVSLSDVYDISYEQALALIRREGGSVEDGIVSLPVQDSQPVPLEQSFPGYRVAERRPVDRQVVEAGHAVLELHFEGVGIVVRGSVGNTRLRSEDLSAETRAPVRGQVVQATFVLDDTLSTRMDLPVSWLKRSPELFHRYELDPGPHRLTVSVARLPAGAFMEIRDVIVYEMN